MIRVSDYRRISPPLNLYRGLSDGVVSSHIDRGVLKFWKKFFISWDRVSRGMFVLRKKKIWFVLVKHSTFGEMWVG